MNEYYSLPVSYLENTISSMIKIISSGTIQVITLFGNVIDTIIERNNINEVLISKSNKLVIKLKKIDNINITTLTTLIQISTKNYIKIYMNLYSLRRLIWNTDNSSLTNHINSNKDKVFNFTNLEIILNSMNERIELIFNCRNKIEFSEIKLIFYFQFTKSTKTIGDNLKASRSDKNEENLEDNFVINDDTVIGIKRKITNRVNDYLNNHELFKKFIFKFKC